MILGIELLTQLFHIQESANATTGGYGEVQTNLNQCVDFLGWKPNSIFNNLNQSEQSIILTSDNGNGKGKVPELVGGHHLHM